MKNIILVTMFALLSIPLFADEDVALTDAPKSFIEQAIAECKTYAVEDEVEEAEELNAYLLRCVNDLLQANDYKEIETLPKK